MLVSWSSHFQRPCCDPEGKSLGTLQKVYLSRKSSRVLAYQVGKKLYPSMALIKMSAREWIFDTQLPLLQETDIVPLGKQKICSKLGKNYGKLIDFTWDPLLSFLSSIRSEKRSFWLKKEEWEFMADHIDHISKKQIVVTKEPVETQRIFQPALSN